MRCDPTRQKLKTRIVQSLSDLFSPGTGNYPFIGFSRTTPWQVDQVGEVPNATDSVKEATDFWREAIAFKRIRPNNVSFVVPRYDWSAGTVYPPYRDDVDLFDDNTPSQFYVLVDNERVYKCIDNNNNAVSSVKPIEVSTRVFETDDGYRWKFIYRINETDRTFLTSEFMPIFRVTSIVQTQDPRQPQFDVQLAAVDGAIDFIDITESGSLFVNAVQTNPDNRIIGVSGASQYQLNGPEISSVEGAYVGYTLKITDDGGAENLEQIRRIVAYSNKTVTLESDFPNGGNSLIGAEFAIIPTVVITGDGTGAAAEANINADGVITSIEMKSRGSGYTYASATMVEPPNDADREILTVLNPVLAQPGGHGFNAIEELGTAGIMISAILDRSESGLVSVDADFRQFGLILNPTVNGVIAGTEEDIIHTYGVESSSPITEFNGLMAGDRIIIGVSSGHLGVFQEFTSTIGQPRTGVLKIKNPNYTFQTNETLRLFTPTFLSPFVTTCKITGLTLEETVNPKNIYRQTTRILTQKINANLTDTTFQGDGQVIGNNSGATATFSTWTPQFITGAGPSTVNGFLEVVDVQGGPFQVGETISTYAAPTAGDPLVTVVSVQEPELDHRSGDVVYIQNVRTLERDNDQREEIRIVITI
jgi:hypothetical protein